ncbi:MAG: serine hydrolase domain-containing protein [Bacteroidales bacterium]|nr:serine hydrolase domain-containing protein [Bacteroidales bacterium]
MLYTYNFNSVIVKFTFQYCLLRGIIFLFIMHASLCFSQSLSNSFNEKNQYFDSLNIIYKQQQTDSLFNFIVKDKHFNGTFLVAQKNVVLYENVAGYACLQQKQPLPIHTSFEIASVSKMFTAVAILMLYEEGKITLNNDVCVYLPEFPYANITVHQLLCHRSRLPEYFKFADRYHKNSSFPLTNDSLLSMLQHRKPKCGSLSNQEFEYCNTNYALLASIVEKILGISFSQFLQENIFNPLGMKETFLYYFGSNQQIVYGHRSNKRRYERNYLSGVVGDKGIFSSVHDLYVWDKALFSGDIIKKETLLLAVSPQHPDISACNNYGYGFRLGCDENGNTLIYHGGLWNGNHSLFIHRPVDDVLIVFLSNVYNKSFTWRSNDILRIWDEL